MAARDIEVANLRLDEENPRHDHVSGERELIAALFLGIDGPKIVKLAEHIVANGMSPTDNAIVIANGDGTYTVVEGNRRVAAVKLLADPSLAPSKSYEATFTRLKAAMSTPVTHLSAVEVKDRDAARPWILLRHADGEADGASTVGWNPVQKQRFAGKSGTQTALALLIIDSLKAADPTNNKLIADLDKVRQSKTTTLGRLVKDQDVRSMLGITKADPVTSTRLSQAELTGVWSQVVADLAAGTKNVTDLKRKEQMQAYVASVLPAHLKPSAPSPTAPPTRSPVPPTPGNPATSPVATPVSPAPVIPSTPAPTLAPTSAVNPALAPGLPPPAKPKAAPLFGTVQILKLGIRVQEVLREVYELDVDRFPNASAVMVRVLVELAVDAVFDLKSWPKTVLNKGGHQEPKTLAAKITECLAALDPSGKDGRFQYLRQTLNQKDGMFSVSSMNAVVHNPYFHPVPNDLRKMVQNYTPFLAGLDSLVP